tara:strand:- start:852 stop:1583 length:732 start_codon:yes stop_codon:yes gene_type:complete
MAVINIVSDHSETIVGNSGAGGSLAASAALTSGTSAFGSSNLLVPTYFKIAFANIYNNNRAFIGFDLSGETGTITDMTISLMRASAATAPVLYFVASEHSDAVAASDYLDGITGQDGYPFTSTATQYSVWNPNGDDGNNTGNAEAVTITLNSAAISAAQSAMGSGKFKLAIVNQYDFNNSYGSAGIGSLFIIQGPYFVSTQHGTTSNHPILNITTGTSAVPRVTKLNLNSGNLILKGGTFVIK